MGCLGAEVPGNVDRKILATSQSSELVKKGLRRYFLLLKKDNSSLKKGNKKNTASSSSQKGVEHPWSDVSIPMPPAMSLSLWVNWQ